tara:strand:+ start:47 stop:166 length:120 start_codon:yes stop_codon:yes gene_type:complete
MDDTLLPPLLSTIAVIENGADGGTGCDCINTEKNSIVEK